MPRGVEDLNINGAHLDVVPLVIEVQTGHLSRQGKQGVARTIGVAPVDIDGRLGQCLLQLRDSGGVVIVAVGEQDVGHLRPALLQRSQDPLRLVPGVNDGGLAGGLVLQNIAVGSDRPYLHDFNLHHLSSSCESEIRN